MKRRPTITDYHSKIKKANFVIFNAISKIHHSRENPLVSIITITKNSENTLERTINSAINQTYKNIEYIIVDAKSTDKTLSIIKDYAKHINYCISEVDFGISDAFNKGIACANGSILGILNSDDWYELTTIEKVVSAFRCHGEGIYHGDLRFWKDAKSQLYSKRGSFNHLVTTMTINHPTVFVTRKVYERIGLFLLDFKVAMDYEWLRWAMISQINFFPINSVLANMQIGGTSNRYFLKALIEEYRARDVHNQPKFTNFFILTVGLIKTVMRKCLKYFRLNWVVNFYRKHFSLQKRLEIDLPK